jgi:hypothetical protein
MGSRLNSESVGFPRRQRADRNRVGWCEGFDWRVQRRKTLFQSRPRLDVASRVLNLCRREEA